MTEAQAKELEQRIPLEMPNVRVTIESARKCKAYVLYLSLTTAQRTLRIDKFDQWEPIKQMWELF